MDKFYVTTPIYYSNAPPHLGHAITSTLADVVARYQRFCGKEVFFLTGTDEHGVKNVRAAEKAGKDLASFVSEIRESFKNLSSALNLSNDDFIYTADTKRHWPGAEQFWKKLEGAGDIYKDKYRGLYCIGHEAFLTEKELIEGKCPDHDEKPQLIEEENYFFRLSKYNAEIKKRIEEGELKIFPETRKNEILSLLDEGLHDVSFSRPSKDISWGIPVPGDASQTMYVWCDALTNYLTGIGYGRGEDWKKWWPADSHYTGKDILRFHAGIWPAMLLSAGLPLPKALVVLGMIQVGGRKMSKTIGNVVDPFALAERYGKEAVRYYFSREVPVFDDGGFTEDKFEAAYEGNLVNGLGNYVQRVSTMARSYFPEGITKATDGELLKVPMKKGEAEYVSVEYFAKEIIEKRYREAMSNFELTRAIDIVFGFLKELDGYVQKYEPFKLVKTDKEKTRAVLWNVCCGAVFLARLLIPFLPETSRKIFDIFGVSEKQETWITFKAKEHKALFPRLEK